jgi:inner membrane protein involved in colicin E2 resistance
MSLKKHAFYLILLTLISHAGAEIRYKLNSLSENSA